MSPSPKGRHVTEPRPRDVAAFRRAESARVLPARPASPPAVEVDPSAHRALRDLGVTASVAVVADVATVLLTAEDGRLPWASVVIVLGVGGAGIVAIAIATKRWGRAVMAEVLRGYTTTTFRMGGFWIARPPDGPWTLNQIHWDFGGTWVLRPDGTVVSTPSDDLDPPGLYPSPNRPDALELWTGRQWSGYFRPPLE